MGRDSPARAPDRLCLRFPAEAGMARQALARVRERFAGTIGADEAGALELALAEVLNNIVEHAYAGQAAGPVRLLVLRQGGTLDCRVEDRGRPMPGLVLPDGRLPSVDGPIEDLAEGGWGWALIRAVTSDLSYERIGGRNRLCFRVPLSGPGDGGGCAHLTCASGQMKPATPVWPRRAAPDQPRAAAADSQTKDGAWRASSVG